MQFDFSAEAVPPSLSRVVEAIDRLRDLEDLLRMISRQAAPRLLQIQRSIRSIQRIGLQLGALDISQVQFRAEGGDHLKAHEPRVG